MRETFKRLSKIKAPVCVTVILKTHKTHPDSQQDPILLRNLISQASVRLTNEYSADISKKYTEKLQKLAEEIDHRHNDLGLLLFVNDDVAEYIRLPINVNSRLIVDDTFATRSIARALNRDTDYYLLALSKGKARLILASSDAVVEEIKRDGFPFEDKALLSLSKAESANANRVTNLTQELFNRVDKALNVVRKQEPHSVVIYSEETNYHQFLKVADYPNTILGHILLKNFDEKSSNLIKEVWTDIKELVIQKERSRISELEKALGTGNYLADLNEIWNATLEGRGKTIFVEEGYYQPVREDDGVFTPIAYEEISSKNDIDDIVDDMIENNLKNGGDVVFLKEGSLKDFQKIALITRY